MATLQLFDHVCAGGWGAGVEAGGEREVDAIVCQEAGGLGYQ